MKNCIISTDTKQKDNKVQPNLNVSLVYHPQAEAKKIGA
jgi:hypothetical protein